MQEHPTQPIPIPVPGQEFRLLVEVVTTQTYMVICRAQDEDEAQEQIEARLAQIETGSAIPSAWREADTFLATGVVDIEPF
jgi:hypothetical protein